MSDNSTKNTKNNNIIDRVEVTNGTLTSRGGLSLFGGKDRGHILTGCCPNPILITVVELRDA